MMNPQLHPLEVNPTTSEPFLRLKQHRNIIITPPRTEDAQHLLVPMNDERVQLIHPTPICLVCNSGTIVSSTESWR